MQSNIAELSKDLEYQYLMESLNASVSKHLLDEHFTLVAANSRYYDMFGYEKAEYEQKFQNRPDLYYKDDPGDWEALNEIVVKTLQEGKNRYECICRMRHKSGRRLWIKLIGTFIDEYINGYQISYSVMMDITDLMQAKIEKNATQNNFPGLIAKYRATADSLIFMEGNDSFHQYFKTRLSFSIEDLNADNGLLEVKKQYAAIRRGESVRCMISPVSNTGGKRFFNVNAQCVDWINGDPVYLLIYTDITELTRQKEQLEEYNHSLHKLAYSDEVTKGFNRRKFDMVAQESIRQAESDTYQMIWMNMQKFKLVNDIGGVDLGDRTLEYVHDKITKHLNRDEYAARMFADNFVILMKCNTKEETEQRLKHMVADINSFNTEASHKYYLTFSAGIYTVHEPCLPIIYMEDRAHAAIKAKHSKNTDLCVCSYYSDEIRDRMFIEKNMENRMREALKHEEFEVYLQPKVSVQTKKIAGAEVLIRWNDPHYGLIPPNDFIPLFETNGFILQLDLYVFEKACSLLSKWLKEGKTPLPISVNMSRVHFQSMDFLTPYIRLREQYAVPFEYLEIELTETMVFEDPDTFTRIIKKIHDAGFRCSMDDFGCGYSTLNSLKDLDVDAIKLDKAFFSSLSMANEKENIIIRSVLRMAKELDMTTVAEGIETVPQVEFLKHTTCDLIQGYVYSKPVPVHEFEKLLDGQLDG